MQSDMSEGIKTALILAQAQVQAADILAQGQVQAADILA